MKMTTSMMIRITLTALLFVVGIALALIIPSHITVTHILSIAFTSIAYLTAAAIFVLSSPPPVLQSTFRNRPIPVMSFIRGITSPRTALSISLFI